MTADGVARHPYLRRAFTFLFFLLTFQYFAMNKLILSVAMGVVVAACSRREGAHQHPPPDMKWVEPFFQDYADAFRSRSSARLLAKFCVPLTFFTRTGPLVVADEAHLTAH